MYYELTDYVGRNPIDFARRRGEGARLVALSTLLKGQVFAFDHLQGAVTIGASETSTFVLRGATIEKKHLKLEKLENRWSVMRASRNAFLWVNGEPVHYAILEHHDRVRIGRHTFIFFEY